MTLYPHDHRMWAADGIYAGREDNTMYRRRRPRNRHLEEPGGKTLDDGDVLLLGDDVIHSVNNPLEADGGAARVRRRLRMRRGASGAPGPREERPFDFDEAGRRQFVEANEAWRSASAG